MGGSLLTVADALERVLAAASPLPPEPVALAASVGRVLAADVASDLDVPPFDRCAMDGIALRSADASRPGARLRVVGTVNAGRGDLVAVAPGECVKVMTGAPLPPDCDAVEQVERLRFEGDGAILEHAVASGRHVSPRGEDLRAGDVALRAGSVVGAAEVGVLAMVGRTEVLVHARPLATILSTGDELVAAGERPGPGQIRNSNGPMLAVLARMMGCDPVHLLPAVRDDRAELEAALARGLAGQVLLVSGGVSKGERDLVQDVLPALGVRNVFHGVAIQPGKPLWFGRTDRCLVFGLPGNPVSALTCSRAFVAPAVRALRGVRDPRPRRVQARLEAPVRRAGSREGWLPAIVRWHEGAFACTPVEASGSADLVAAAASNATWIAPVGRDAFEPGDVVDVLLHFDHFER